jgi:hypothetical protein
MDSIGIEATSRSSGDIHNLSLPVVLFILCVVILIGIISSRSLRARSFAVHHLFLKILFKRSGRELTGFVRTLDFDQMRLVMTEAPTRGEALEMNLSSLPGFPSDKTLVVGTVAKVKPIGGQNHNYLVSLKLNVPGSSMTLQDSMINYLKHLHA